MQSAAPPEVCGTLLQRPDVQVIVSVSYAGSPDGLIHQSSWTFILYIRSGIFCIMMSKILDIFVKNV